MALIQDGSITKHLMRLSMAAGLVLLAAGTVHGWKSTAVPAPPHPPAAEVVLSPRALDTKLVVDLGDRRVVVYRHGKELARYPVAVGQAGWETPIGEFKIHQMRRNPEWRHPITKVVIPAGPDNPLGDRWIGFYQGEHMALGFHGTPNESLVGQAVSHGCLRMRNRDIERMFEQVGTGSVVEVQS
jgi:lipoprotein-anchoring transpeptidase ErfK/SrfK